MIRGIYAPALFGLADFMNGLNDVAPILDEVGLKLGPIVLDDAQGNKVGTILFDDDDHPIWAAAVTPPKSIFDDMDEVWDEAYGAETDIDDEDEEPVSFERSTTPWSKAYPQKAEDLNKVPTDSQGYPSDTHSF